LYGASLLDLIPTVLSLFGLPIGDDMDGRPWLEIFDQEVRPLHIPTWEDVEGESGMHGEDRREDPVAAAEAIRHLVDLGYIEAPSDDIQKTICQTTIDLKTNLASALSDGYRADEAMSLWRELIEMSPADSPNIYGYRIEIARCHMQLANFEESERILNELESEKPDDGTVPILLGQLKLRGQQPQEALKHFRVAEAKSEETSHLPCAMGKAYAQLAMWDDAEKAFRRALDADDENAVALNGLARVAIEHRHFEEAADHALRAVGLMHLFPSAHYNLGVALVESGMTEEAIHALETCVAMAPEMLPAHQRLVEIYRQNDRDSNKAREHAIAVKRLETLANPVASLED
jgi:tetratricopeptide (TPR) repeat protein